ncbi:heme-dependent peroxidase [bacterium]|nr:MAG: heme-dependent peroxidase [bacterium]
MHNPNVPETLHGWSILHRLYAFDRRRWSALSTDRQAAIQREALRAFEQLEGGDKYDFALCQVLGGKGDLMFIHYARDFEALAEAEMAVSGLEINDYLQPRSSYVSVLEVGRHRATARIHEELRERDLEANSAEWVAAFDQAIAEETAAVAARLWAQIPRRRFWCFYPMNKKRDDTWNWYALPFDERCRLMAAHGAGAKTYHGLATQVISSSIGFDDWEWGVDLFSDDPLVLKRLIYELRFDEVSSQYAEFGSFVTGLRFSPAQLPEFLAGRAVPRLLEARELGLAAAAR